MPQSKPVRLDPFQRIVNVGWSAAGLALLRINTPLDPLDYDYIVHRTWIELYVTRKPPLGDIFLGITGNRQYPPGYGGESYGLPAGVWDGLPAPSGLGLPHMPPQEKFDQAYALWTDSLPIVGNVYGGDHNWLFNLARIRRAYAGSISGLLIRLYGSVNSAYAEPGTISLDAAIQFQSFNGKLLADFPMDERGHITPGSGVGTRVDVGATRTGSVTQGRPYLYAEIRHDLTAQASIDLPNLVPLNDYPF